MTYVHYAIFFKKTSFCFFRPLPIPFRIYFRCKGTSRHPLAGPRHLQLPLKQVVRGGERWNGKRYVLLERKSHKVHHQYLHCQHHSSPPFVQYRSSQETTCTPIVHWGAGNVEWKTLDFPVHQDPEVIAQVGSGDTESPHRREDKDVAYGDQSIANSWSVKKGRDWLGNEGTLIAIKSGRKEVCQ